MQILKDMAVNGSNGNINVDVHFMTTLKCSQINFRKIRQVC